MCTVTWRATAAGLELWFNRDEKRTRAPETAPIIAERGGVRFLAPRDGAAGGAWAGANEYGLALALLNRYVPDAGPERRETRSRGLLMVDLFDAARAADVGERLAETELERYPPFSLLALDPTGRARLFEWTGWRLEEEADAAARMPLASSSFDQTAARSHRRTLWDDMLAGAGGRVTGDLLDAFHHSHVGGPGPFSVCMHRADAETRSLTRVMVRATEVEVTWRPSAPCAGAADQRFVLPRRASTRVAR